MESPNIDFDAPRREREKVERQIHKLWVKWDKQGGPSEEEQEEILAEFPKLINREWKTPVDDYCPPNVEALIGYKYKDMGIFEFLANA